MQTLFIPSQPSHIPPQCNCKTSFWTLPLPRILNLNSSSRAKLPVISLNDFYDHVSCKPTSASYRYQQLTPMDIDCVLMPHIQPNLAISNGEANESREVVFFLHNPCLHAYSIKGQLLHMKVIHSFQIFSKLSELGLLSGSCALSLPQILISPIISSMIKGLASAFLSSELIIRKGTLSSRGFKSPSQCTNACINRIIPSLMSLL